jgi:hypothetical protein
MRRHRPDTCENPACDDDPVLCPNKIICETVPPQWLSLIDVVCVLLFTTDYLIRIILAPFVPARYGGSSHSLSSPTPFPFPTPHSRPSDSAVC